MTAYTPQQLLVALGKARRHAWRTKKTVHVVVNDGLLAWATGPLRVIDRVEPHHSVVIRDVHPQPMTGEMVDAYCEAICHDYQRADHIALALRRIMKKEDGTPMNAEELALLLWDMAEHIVRADEARITQERLESYRIYPTSRRANNARQELRN